MQTRRSTSGGAALLGNHLVKHWSATQKSVTLSSGEAELGGLVKGAGEALGLQSLGRGLQIDFRICLYADSAAAIGICRRSGIGRARHLAAAQMRVQERLRENSFSLFNVLGTENPSDLLTKYLPHSSLRLHLSALGVRSGTGRAASAPLVSAAETQIRVFLLTKVTIVVFSSFDFLGYELEREGNVLILPEGQVGVEEACSGIRSLTACLFAGSFLASVFLDRFWKKILLVGAAMLFAVLTNLIRSIFLTLWAYYHGSQAIDEHWVLPLIGDIGTVHDVTGMAILFFTCIGLICLLPIFNYKLNDFEEDEDWNQTDPTESA